MKKSFSRNYTSKRWPLAIRIWLLRNMESQKSVPEEFSGKGLEKLFDISNFTAMTYEEHQHSVPDYPLKR